MISIEQATARDADAICRIDATVLGDIGRNGQLRQWIAAGQCSAARQDGEVVGYAVMDQSFFRQSFVELIVVHPCTVSEKALAKRCSFTWRRSARRRNCSSRPTSPTSKCSVSAAGWSICRAA